MKVKIYSHEKKDISCLKTNSRKWGEFKKNADESGILQIDAYLGDIIAVGCRKNGKIIDDYYAVVDLNGEIFKYNTIKEAVEEASRIHNR